MSKIINLNDLLVKPVIFAIGIACGIVFTQLPAFAQDTEEHNSRKSASKNKRKHAGMREAEKTFGMGKGHGLKLMTQEEWREHQRKMQSMTAEERERYSNEVHERMVERAKEKGISLPDTPGPRGSVDKNGTPGRGRGGMGGGGGRGR